MSDNEADYQQKREAAEATERELARAYAAQRNRNNPHNEPTGPFTGRCPRCGSNDLWDDNLAYGCNACHAILGTN